MLVELSIENFAIIDKVRISLAPGFNTMTGETGAGKSILIDAVGALLGARIGPEAVRAGFDTARVEGVFCLSEIEQADISGALSEMDIVFEEDGLIVSRDIYKTGRTTCRINGRAVTQSVLQQVGQRLIDIHGQSEHLSLLRTSEHVSFLDRFGGLQELRAEVGRAVGDLRRVRREIHNLLQDEREMARRLDLLRFQVAEIEAAKLIAGEEEVLTSEHSLTANAERLKELSNAAYELLREGEQEQASVIDLLGLVTSQISELSKLDPSMEDQSVLVENISYQLEDIARSVRAYRDAAEFNPGRLAEIEERLELISRLKRKYGVTIEEILEYGGRAAREMESLANVDERVHDLQDQETKLLDNLGEKAGRLSRQRKQAGNALATRIEAELSDLNMSGTGFSVSIEQVEAEDGVPAIVAEVSPVSNANLERRYAFDATGIDRVEFLLSPNPGEPLKPLAKIASGGETSRLMLAMKTVLSEADPVSTLIFDEIDVGIGGRSGVIVGQKLYTLSEKHQVLCVTHLPQIASFADVHFNIAKGTLGDRTVSIVRPLSDEERVEEIAQMLGGATETTRSSAREMLANSSEFKSARIENEN